MYVSGPKFQWPSANLKLVVVPNETNSVLAVGGMNEAPGDKIYNMKCNDQGQCKNWTVIGHLEEGRSGHLSMWVPSSKSPCRV